MFIPRFIQIHTLTPYVGVLLNRDDNNLAKRLCKDGLEFTRVSSQCLRYNLRKADCEYSISSVAETSIRSRETFVREMAKPLIAEGFDTKLVVTALRCIQDTLCGVSAKEQARRIKAEAKRIKAGGQELSGEELLATLKQNQIVVLGRPEVVFITGLARDILVQGGDEMEVATKASEAMASQRDNMRAMWNNAGLDVAMFGRMSTGDPKARVDAAIHVAHAFTVHPQASESDFFTAVDDLLSGEGESGAGHLGETEINSGLYYGYVVVDVPGLVSNIEGCSRAAWLDANRETAATLVSNLIHLITTVTPGAKKGSTAPYSSADLLMVEIGSKMPRSLAAAFDGRVAPGGEAAAAALARYLSRKDAMHGADTRRLYASIFDADMPGVESCPVPEIAELVAASIRAGISP